jgi:PAS domain-containing protein
VVTFTDITESKRVEEALRESEAKYRDLFETVQEVFYLDRLIYDEQGNVVDWIFEDLNPAGFELLGLKDIDDAKGKRGSEVLGHEVALFYLPMIEKARRSSKAVTFQYHSPYVDKEFLTSYIVRGDRLISAQMDVTGLKQAEEALLYLAEIIYDKDGKPHDYRFLEVNPAYELNTGVNREQILGKSLFEVFPNASPTTIKKYDEVAISGQPAHFEVFSQSVNNKYLDVYAFSPEKGKLAVIFRNITEIKKAEEMLKKSEEQYRTLFNTMNEGFCIVEMLFDEHEKPIDYIYIEANQAFDNQTVLKNVIGKRMRELAPGHEECWFEIYGKVALTGESVRFENRAEALGRWYEVYAYRVGQPEDRKVAVIFNNITERKRAEEALRESEEKYRLLIEHAPSAIYEIDLIGQRFISVNEGACKILGYTEAELMAMSPIDVLGEESKSAFLDREKSHVWGASCRRHRV